MYTRSYYPEQNEPINLPENYDGVTFSSQNEPNPPANEVTASSVPNKNPWENPQDSTATCGVGARGDGLFSGLKGIPFLSGIFGGGGLSLGSLRLPKIGSEEILIIGAALFLFFSKDGDRECALMLLLLLLIT